MSSAAQTSMELTAPVPLDQAARVVFESICHDGPDGLPEHVAHAARDNLKWRDLSPEARAWWVELLRDACVPDDQLDAMDAPPVAGMGVRLVRPTTRTEDR